MLEKRVSFLEEILGISDNANPEALVTNRVSELGSVVVSLLQEIRWNRAFVTELIAQGKLPPELVQKVDLRVKLLNLEENLVKTQALRETSSAVPGLLRQIQEKITRLEIEISKLKQELNHA